MDGNKLRDALRKARVFIDCSPLKRVEGDFGCIDRDEIRAEIDAILAGPVKNCEVGTAEEQANRWYWRYHVGHLCQSCPLGPRKWSEMDKVTLCFSDWLQMPYEEGGAK